MYFKRIFNSLMELNEKSEIKDNGFPLVTNEPFKSFRRFQNKDVNQRPVNRWKYTRFPTFFSDTSEGRATISKVEDLPGQVETGRPPVAFGQRPEPHTRARGFLTWHLSRISSPFTCCCLCNQIVHPSSLKFCWR